MELQFLFGLFKSRLLSSNYPKNVNTWQYIGCTQGIPDYLCIAGIGGRVFSLAYSRAPLKDPACPTKHHDVAPFIFFDLVIFSQFQSQFKLFNNRLSHFLIAWLFCFRFFPYLLIYFMATMNYFATNFNIYLAIACIFISIDFAFSNGEIFDAFF